MTLKNKINQAMKVAMKAKDKATLRALRSIKSMILLAETAEGADGNGLTEKEEIKLLSKAAKQRKESYEQYMKNGREDLAKIEKEELDVIQQYLPKQMSEAELTEALKEIVAKVGATSMRDMGKVMGMATKQFAGKADGKTIAKIVRSLLG